MKTKKTETQKKSTTKASKAIVGSSVAVKSAKPKTVRRKTVRTTLSRTESLKKDLRASLKTAQAKISSTFSETVPMATAKIQSIRQLLGQIDISKSKIESMLDLTALKKQVNGAKKSLKKTQKRMGLDQKGSRRILSIIGICLLMTGALLIGRKAFAADNSGSLNTLGDQSKMMQKARPSIPANTYRVVQKRVIDRDYRSELGVSLGTVANGGDSYYETKNLGVQYDFHLNSRFSVGLRYQMNFNNLTPEGRRVYDRAEAMANAGNTNYVVPDLDQPLSTALATASFYPVYGKVSWFESTVSYFDFYLMAGGGQMQLKSGPSAVVTAGLGMGMWWTQYLTSRFEARYQTYEDQLASGKRKIEGAVATFTMGILL